MVKTLFFDFGNVIAHFDHRRAVQPLARFTEMTAAELYATLYDNPLEESYERGEISTGEYVAEALHRARLSCSASEFLALFCDIFTPNPEVIHVIPDLAKRYRIVLASNTNDAHYSHYCREYVGTLRHFAATPTSHQAGARKPAAAFFEYCQQFANASPGECAFIDDIAANVEAGQRHGWLGIHYRSNVPFADQLRAAGITFDR